MSSKSTFTCNIGDRLYYIKRSSNNTEAVMYTRLHSHPDSSAVVPKIRLGRLRLSNSSETTDALAVQAVSGLPLSSALSEEGLKFLGTTRVGVISSVVNALKVLLKAGGVVHGDLKGEHIIVSPTGAVPSSGVVDVKFIDFNLSSVCADLKENYTKQQSKRGRERRAEFVFKGNLLYASLYHHFGMLHEDAADLQSLCFILSEIEEKHPLPWTGFFSFHYQAAGTNSEYQLQEACFVVAIEKIRALLLSDLPAKRPWLAVAKRLLTDPGDPWQVVLSNIPTPAPLATSTTATTATSSSCYHPPSPLPSPSPVTTAAGGATAVAATPSTVASQKERPSKMERLIKPQLTQRCKKATELVIKKKTRDSSSSEAASHLCSSEELEKDLEQFICRLKVITSGAVEETVRNAMVTKISRGKPVPVSPPATTPTFNQKKTGEMQIDLFELQLPADDVDKLKEWIKPIDQVIREHTTSSVTTPSAKPLPETQPHILIGEVAAVHPGFLDSEVMVKVEEKLCQLDDHLEMYFKLASPFQLALNHVSCLGVVIIAYNKDFTSPINIAPPLCCLHFSCPFITVLAAMGNTVAYGVELCAERHGSIANHCISNQVCQSKQRAAAGSAT
eukprot:TRINITY_DN8928_c0_g1_i2.p1 TRINITY_DN8928_c0_g1~~TRINITY_DN8928_c0_g1_i2.p1  ORF type:complete len:617 (-),score=125.22 TRINITY_DN8928_c0_g1_i2:369-2219(-)